MVTKELPAEVSNMSMNKKAIFEDSGYGKSLKDLLLCIVPEDSVKIKQTLGAGVDSILWESRCHETSTEIITIVKKNGKVIGKEVINKESNLSTEYVYGYNWDRSKEPKGLDLNAGKEYYKCEKEVSE